MISKNTVNIFFNFSSPDKPNPKITLGLETNETLLGKSVDYTSNTYGSND
jgi:hypothetical protein